MTPETEQRAPLTQQGPAAVDARGSRVSKGPGFLRTSTLRGEKLDSLRKLRRESLERSRDDIARVRELYPLATGETMEIEIDI